MGEEIRKTGIDIIGDVRWGTHFCQFYQTKEDLIDILVPYFKAGLENNESCIWVTSEPLNEKEAEEAMIRVIPDFTQYLKSGQIEIIPYTEWYTKSEKFDADEVLQGWVKKEKQALKRGFDGLRLTGNTFWLERKDWKDFSDYEEEVNSVIGEYRMLAICTYSLDRCGASEVIDVVSNHQFALIRREGKWELIESSEHKRAEEALRESEERIHTIVSNAPVVIWALDKEGIFTLSEGAGLKSLGLRPGEVVGQSVFDVYRDVPKILEDNRRALSGETIVSTVEVGELVYESHYSPVRNKNREIIGMVGVSTDITEHKRAEEALRESEGKYKALVEEAPVGVMNVDIKGKITYVNKTILQSTGYLREELVGKNAFRLGLVSRETIGVLVRRMKEKLAGKPPSPLEIRFKCKDGKWIWLEIRGKALREHGMPVGIQIIGQNITERKRAEQALRESEQNFRHSLDNSPLGTRIINAEGETIYDNRAILDIYGCSGIEEFESIPAVERHTPQSYAERQERMSKRKEGLPVPDYFEQSIINKDGEVRDLEVFNLEVLWGGEKQFQLIYRDITERKRAEQALQESEEKYRSLFESMLNGFAYCKILVNEDNQPIDFVHLEVNDAWERAIGLKREDIIGKKITDVIPGIKESKPDLISIYGKVALTGEATQFELYFEPLGKWFTISVYSPQKGYFVAVFEDITERKRAEEREKELQKELNLASRLASVGELAAGVAHEINNPLTGILAFSERLLRKSTDEKASRDLKRIHNEAGRVAKVVERFLTFARRREPKKEISDVNRILRRALQLRAYELKTSNIEVETDLAPGLPRIMVDFHQIQEVFLSIIMNAEQAMTEADRGGKLGIKTQQMKNCIRISFTNDGPGIPPEHLGRVFDPFFFTTREKIGGTGLGLSVCHGIVQRHDGRIYAKSKPGKGATFAVELPLTGEKVKEAKQS